MPSTLKQVFPLNKLERVLAGYRLPREAFEPAGNYENRYGIYTCVGQGARTGTLTLQRQGAPGAVPQLKIDFEKKSANRQSCRCTGAIRVGEGPLGQPDFWRFEYHVENAGGAPFGRPRFSRTFRVKEGKVVSNAGKFSEQLPQAAYTLNWSLFDAVQRLPREPQPAHRFALIDHYDRVLPNQALTYRGAFEVTIGEHRVQQKKVVHLEKGQITRTFWGVAGGVNARLHAFDHLGPATLPWVYWVNEAGRLLFAVSGLEGYILETEPKKR